MTRDGNLSAQSEFIAPTVVALRYRPPHGCGGGEVPGSTAFSLVTCPSRTGRGAICRVSATQEVLLADAGAR